MRSEASTTRNCKHQKRNNGCVTWEWWAEEWLAECVAAIPRTEPIYRAHLTRLGRHVGFRLIDDVTPAALARAFADELDCRVSRSTLSEVWQTGRRFCRWAQARGVVESNPFDSVLRPQPEWAEPFTLSAAQLRQLIIAWPLTYNGACVALAATTGLRLGEIIALTWGDLDGSALRIRKTLYRSGEMGARWRVGSPKSRAGLRTVFLPPWAVDVLASHRLIAAYHNPGSKIVRPALTSKTRDWIFPAPRGGLWRQDGPRRALTAMIRRSRVPRVTFHGLRHSFATVALASGVDICTLSTALGHTHPGFTLRWYGHASPEALEALARRVGASLDPGG